MPAAPLWAPLTLSFVNSLGTGAITAGVFFLTEQALGYGRTANFALGVAFGVVYVAAAFGVGPLLRRIKLPTRRVLALTLWGQGLACALPPFAVLTTGEQQPWAWWALTLLYGLFSGAMWPPIESYLAGGRRGPKLARATGLFNILWAGAMIVAYWAMAPLVEQHQHWAVAGLGACQILSLPILLVLPAFSAAHHDDGEPHPPHYERLLSVFRVLLPASYLVAATIHPVLPSTLDQLRVPTAWKTPVASIWLTARVAGFILFERWHGWRGRWSYAILGPALLVGGFAATIASPLAADAAGHGAGLACLVFGLMSFGFGASIIYAAAIYYALTVGKSEVAAGGTHEALIGIGMTGGPAAGLAVSGCIGLGWLPAEAFELSLIVVVITVASAVAWTRLATLRRAWRSSSS